MPIVDVMKSQTGPKISFKKIATNDIVLAPHQRPLTPLKFTIPEDALRAMCFLKPPIVVFIENKYRCVANAAPVAFLTDCGQIQGFDELVCGVLIHQDEREEETTSIDREIARWRDLEKSAATLFSSKISVRGQLQLRKLLHIAKSPITLGAQNLMRLKK